MKKLFIILMISGFYCYGNSQVISNTEIAKEVITGFEQGKMDIVARHFDENMLLALPEEKLKFVWNDLIKQCGDFQNYSKITTEKIEEYDVVYVLCHFKNLNLKMKVVFNKQNLISGLFFIPEN